MESFAGAVTHVFVNNPKEGYAVFGDLMIKTGNTQWDKNRFIICLNKGIGEILRWLDKKPTLSSEMAVRKHWRRVLKTKIEPPVCYSDSTKKFLSLNNKSYNN